MIRPVVQNSYKADKKVGRDAKVVQDHLFSGNKLNLMFCWKIAMLVSAPFQASCIYRSNNADILTTN